MSADKAEQMERLERQLEFGDTIEVLVKAGMDPAEAKIFLTPNNHMSHQIISLPPLEAALLLPILTRFGLLQSPVVVHLAVDINRLDALRGALAEVSDREVVNTHDFTGEGLRRVREAAEFLQEEADAVPALDPSKMN